MRLAEVARAGGCGGSGGPLGLDGSFLVLIGGFSLLEDVDDMLALLNSTRKIDSQRLESMDVGCTVARFPTTWQGSGEDLAVSGGQRVAQETHVRDDLPRPVDDSHRLGELHLGVELCTNQSQSYEDSEPAAVQMSQRGGRGVLCKSTAGGGRRDFLRALCGGMSKMTEKRRSVPEFQALFQPPSRFHISHGLRRRSIVL